MQTYSATERFFAFIAALAHESESLLGRADLPLRPPVFRDRDVGEMARHKGQTGTRSGVPYQTALSVRVSVEHRKWLRGKRVRGWVYEPPCDTPRFNGQNQIRMIREAAEQGGAHFDGITYTEARHLRSERLIDSDFPEVADRFQAREFDGLLCASTTRVAQTPRAMLHLVEKFRRIDIPVLFIHEGAFLNMDPKAHQRILTTVNDRRALGARRAATRRARGSRSQSAGEPSIGLGPS